MPKFFFFISFLFFASSAQAQFFTAQEEEIHELILKLEVEQARQNIYLSSRLSESQIYLYCFASFMEALIGADPAYSETFYKDCEKALKQLDSYDDTPKNIALKGQIRFFSALVNYRDENTISAAYDLMKAYNAAEELKENHADYIHGYPLRIVIEGLLASLPESVAENLAFFGFEGSIQAAQRMLSEMKEASKLPEYAYLDVYSYFLADYVAIQHEPSTFKSNPVPARLMDYPTVLFYKSLFLTNSFKAQQALKFIDKIELSRTAIQPSMLLYLEGKCKLFLQHEDAHYALKKFLDLHKGRDFVKSANLHLAYYYFLEGKHDLSDYYRSQILKNGAERVGFDAFAMKEADRAFNRDLILAQLMFDGGSFKALDAFLSGINPSAWNEADKVELAYRKARLAQMIGDDKKAKSNFESLVAAPDHIQVYMQANSYLQLAKMAMKVDDCSEAIAQAKKCLEFKSYPYDDGIRIKAKAILSNCD